MHHMQNSWPLPFMAADQLLKRYRKILSVPDWRWRATSPRRPTCGWRRGGTAAAAATRAGRAARAGGPRGGWLRPPPSRPRGTRRPTSTGSARSSEVSQATTELRNCKSHKLSGWKCLILGHFFKVDLSFDTVKLPQMNSLSLILHRNLTSLQKVSLITCPW